MSNLSTRRVSDDAIHAIHTLLGERPIAYHAPLARALGSATAAIFLSQLLYWTPKTKAAEGWIWKTREEIYEETALTRYEQEGARKVLVKSGAIQEKLRGVPAKMHFRVQLERVIELLSQAAAEPGDPHRGKKKAGAQEDEPHGRPNKEVEVPPTSWGFFPRLDGGSSPNKEVEVPPTISESTTETTTENHNSVVVVDALRKFGISKPTAEQLAHSYPEQYILEKLDFVQWLKESRSSLIAKSPAGYLRRALEEDYQPPPVYKPAAQRKAEQERQVRQLELEQQERQEAEEQFLKTKAQAREALRKDYPPQPITGTELTTETAWQQAMGRLQAQMTDANYQTWLKDTRLVSCEAQAAVIVAPSSFIVEWLSRRFAPLIEKELQQVLGYRVSTKYLALSELGAQQNAEQLSAPPTT